MFESPFDHPKSGFTWLLYKCEELRRAASGLSATERPLGTIREQWGIFFPVSGFYLVAI